jgi:hypothetical protein
MHLRLYPMFTVIPRHYPNHFELIVFQITH